VEWYWHGNSPDLSTRALLQSFQQNHLVANQEEFGKGNYEFSLKVFLFVLQSDFLHTVKCYNMGLMALLALQRKAYCGFLSPLTFIGRTVQRLYQRMYFSLAERYNVCTAASYHC
jgi:hypothetical protein